VQKLRKNQQSAKTRQKNGICKITQQSTENTAADENHGKHDFRK